MARRLVAEFLGTALLLVAVVGSGIATETDPGTQLFAHAIVVGVALVALILTFGHVSGAHFNPAVTLALLRTGDVERVAVLPYVAAQTAGAVVGTAATQVMFGLPLLDLATKDRSGIAVLGSEALATFGLVVVIIGVARSPSAGAVPGAVGAWIAAAIVATSSTSLANPAVTVARMFTDTWTGIAPVHVAPFVAVQVVGAIAAAMLAAWLFPPPTDPEAPMPVPSPTERREATT